MVHMACTKQKDDEADWTMKFRAERITLGKEPDGKLITSLALALESEARGNDGSAAPSQGERYSIHDAMAVCILNTLKDPSASRGDLAVAVMGTIGCTSIQPIPRAMLSGPDFSMSTRTKCALAP